VVSGEPCVAWSLRVLRRDKELLHLAVDASDSLPLAIAEGDRVAHLASPLAWSIST